MARLLSPTDMATTYAAAFAQSRPWSEAEFTSLLTSPTAFAVGDARCFALVRVIVDEAELLTIATHPDHRRQGLARSVMVDWQNMATQRAAEIAFLDVAADNAPARNLYKNCGFAICGNRPNYYARQSGPAVDAILMRRVLHLDK